LKEANVADAHIKRLRSAVTTWQVQSPKERLLGKWVFYTADGTGHDYEAGTTRGG
jgi:hypothetical protein